MSTLTTAIVVILKPILTILLIKKLNKKNKMRSIDGFGQPCKDTYLQLCIGFAKQEIADDNLPPTTDVKELALDYCHQYGCIMGDLEPYNPVVIPAWGGAKPIKVPR